MINEQLKNVFLSGKDNFEDILGQENVKSQLKSALLMDRHILIVGPPGIGKTTLAKNVAKLLPDIEVVSDCSFHCDPKKPLCPECLSKKGLKAKKIKGAERFIRIQGSPDLTAEDLLGDIDPIKALQYGPLSMQAFTPGKIFKANRGVLFFDELNRCPEKLQNALLQVLSERKATLGSYEVDIEADFIFIATMNPEDSSTEKLSDVLLDRFDIVYMGYPEDISIEMQIVKEKGKKVVDFDDELLQLAISFVRLLRDDEKVEKKPSVRASLGLYERAQGNAVLARRKKVTFDDIKNSIVSVLSHRVELKASVKYLKSAKEYIAEEFKKFSKKFEPEESEEGEVP